jgi:hypothetical protein
LGNDQKIAVGVAEAAVSHGGVECIQVHSKAILDCHTEPKLDSLAPHYVAELTEWIDFYRPFAARFG